MKKLLLILAIPGFITLNSCKKSGCFDQSLKDRFANSACTMDCPGVIGCDGKTYCNECIANSQGIHVP